MYVCTLYGVLLLYLHNCTRGICSCSLDHNLHIIVCRRHRLNSHCYRTSLVTSPYMSVVFQAVCTMDCTTEYEELTSSFSRRENKDQRLRIETVHGHFKSLSVNDTVVASTLLVPARLR